MFFASAIHAESVYYEIESGGQNVAAVATVMYAENIPYISLNELLGHLGGALETVDGFCRITYNGIDVTLEPDMVAVATPDTTFSMIYPARLHEKSLYIAQADVPGFFSKAYKIVAAQSTQTVPPAPSPGAEEPLLDENPDSMLDTVSVPGPTPNTSHEGEDESAANTVDAPPAPENLDDSEEDKKIDGSVKITDAILFDPGHGGQDVGIIAGESVMEKDVSLALVLKTRNILKETSPLTVYVTRDADKDVLQNARAKSEYAAKSSLLISLHAGYSFSPQTAGVVLFVDQLPSSLDAKADEEVRQAYMKRRANGEKAAKIAYAIAQHIAEENTLGSVTVRKAPLILQHLSEIPCIMIELAYLSNPDVVASITEDAYQTGIAEALARAIIKASTDTKN